MISKRKIISILGSTGSIGINTLDVISQFPSSFSVYGLACNKNIGLLARQIEKFKPEIVTVLDEEKAAKLKKTLKRKKVKIYSGAKNLIRLCENKKIDMVVAALTGRESLDALMGAIDKGKDIAIANKEVIVGFGDVLMKNAARKKTRILPVDSEISAIFQCLEGKNLKDVKEVILTASGGPFYNFPADRLKKVKMEDAVNHPVWKMGRKISVDSATLMNKGLEVIETCKFFGIPPDRIKVLVHPRTIVHSIVSFVDGTSIAQMSVADMRIPIQYALFYPKRMKTFLSGIDFSRIGKLDFFKPSTKLFPCLKYAFRAASLGGCMPAVLSASDEVAVDAFLEGRIGFMDIPKVIKKVMDKYRRTTNDERRTTNLKELLKADEWAREEAEKIICSGRVYSA